MCLWGRWLWCSNKECSIHEFHKIRGLFVLRKSELGSGPTAPWSCVGTRYSIFYPSISSGVKWHLLRLCPPSTFQEAGKGNVQKLFLFAILQEATDRLAMCSCSEGWNCVLLLGRVCLVSLHHYWQRNERTGISSHRWLSPSCNSNSLMEVEALHGLSLTAEEMKTYKKGLGQHLAKRLHCRTAVGFCQETSWREEYKSVRFLRHLVTLFPWVAVPLAEKLECRLGSATRGTQAQGRFKLDSMYIKSAWSILSFSSANLSTDWRRRTMWLDGENTGFGSEVNSSTALCSAVIFSTNPMPR